MKTWLSKFMRGQEDAENALRRPPITPPSNDGLHDSIMRAVRTAAREEATPHKLSLMWVAAVCVVMLAAAGVSHLRSNDSPQVALVDSSELAAAPGTALDLGAQMPNLLMQPLSNEMARVDHDIHSTTQVLLASFP